MSTGRKNRRSLHYAPPDFLSRPVALMICMRLSLQRAAHAVVASSAKQEIRVRSGENQAATSRLRVGGPGLAFETWVSPQKSVLPKHPGLKSETWATHSIFVRAIFIFLGGP